MLKQRKIEGWKIKKKKRVGEEVGTTKMVRFLNPPTKHQHKLIKLNVGLYHVINRLKVQSRDLVGSFYN